MRAIATAFLLLALAAATVPAQDIDQAIRNMLEHRIAEMDDPKLTQRVDVEGFEAFGIVSLDGVLENLRIRGIHDIVIQSVSLDLFTMDLSLDIFIPTLTIDATLYDLKGRFGGIIPIFGKGPMTATTTDIRVIGTAKLVVSSDDLVSVTSFKNTLTLGGLTCNFENLLLGEDLGDLMNYIIGDMVPFVVRNQQREVAAALEELVVEMANETLAGVTMEELLEQILEFA